MLALDENHYYGNHGYPYGIYSPETLQQTVADMADLVRRDRCHASIFAWNLCNEVRSSKLTVAGSHSSLHTNRYRVLAGHVQGRPRDCRGDAQRDQHP